VADCQRTVLIGSKLLKGPGWRHGSPPGLSLCSAGGTQAGPAGGGLIAQFAQQVVHPGRLALQPGCDYVRVVAEAQVVAKAQANASEASVTG